MDQGPCNEKWCAIHNKPVKTTSQHMDHHLFMIEDVHIYTCLGGGGGGKKKRGGGRGGGGGEGGGGGGGRNESLWKSFMGVVSDEK